MNLKYSTIGVSWTQIAGLLQVGRSIYICTFENQASNPMHTWYTRLGLEA